MKNYRKRVSQYLKEHQDKLAIYKLHHNKPLTKQDVEQLEHILWDELGTKEDYQNEFGDTSITRLVHQTVGLDRNTALAAFSEFLSEERLNSHQIKFVHLIVDYIVSNGYLEKKVLREDPFRSFGSITELFQNNIGDAQGIIQVIDQINNNTNFTEGA
ncbi:type I restriction-modification enzyme R subunit C-terminal domain-containing protein [Paraliobacillus sp. JSM ZJ581]|uniref:type I restriction-modification enzyme R subunit C-terminal domain-containing protein n=1 Tax=Paraliobacillus sp. JSM ZJ581 TaxID=3342118 RepID=UPI0035A825E7